MTALFGRPKPPPNYVTATTPPSMNDPSVQAAGAALSFAAGKAKGRGSTIMTSGTGVSGRADVTKKVLLGG